MSTVPMPRRVVGNGYPTTDPKYLSESELHRLSRNALIETLQAFYADEPLVHVTGDVLLFYEEGDRRKHLAPDLFVAFGVGKQIRNNYLMWEEAPPSVVLESTSPTTRADDLGPKFALYRDTLREQAEQQREQAEQQRERAEAENARLRRLLEQAGIPPGGRG